MIGQETLYKRTLNSLSTNKKLREEGKHIAIPYGFPRLDKEFPGITQGTYHIVSASQKVGKSQITDALYIFNVVNFILTQPTNIKAKIFSFNLEMSSESKMRQVMAYRLFQKHKIILSPRKLQSLLEDYILADDILRFIDEDREWFEKFEQIVSYQDNIRNPTGIFKHMVNYARDNGSYYDKNNQIIPMELILKNDEAINKTIDRYEMSNPDEYRIVITDHIGLLNQEKHEGQMMNLYDTIAKWSSDYCIRLRNKFKYTIVNVQQQAAMSESLDAAKMDMKEPSAANLSDYKSSSKDVNVLLALHSPFRAKQRTYMGYNIERLKDNFRQLFILLDREGSACETSLYFNGACNVFKELPAVEQMTPALYDEITKRQ